jgi:hypothetical protein
VNLRADDERHSTGVTHRTSDGQQMSFPSQAVFTSTGRAQPLRFSLTRQETKCLMSDDLLLAFGGAWLAIIVVKGVVEHASASP